MEENKKCIFCKRTLVEGKKIPICSNCTNKVGSVAISVGGIAIGALGFKNIKKK